VRPTREALCFTSSDAEGSICPLIEVKRSAMLRCGNFGF
jgi:hypothetical protein